MRGGLPASAWVSASALALSALALVGCTSSTPAGGSSSSVASSTAASSSSSGPASSSPEPTPPASTASTSLASTSAPASSPASSAHASTDSTAPAVRACAAAGLTVAARKEGAVPGAELALLSFTNTSSTECSLTGFPGVSLRLGSTQLGQPAARSDKSVTTVLLRPGAVASTTLTDVSSCQGELSDTVRIYPPNSTTFVDQPLVLRGCTLHIDPVAPAQ